MQISLGGDSFHQANQSQIPYYHSRNEAEPFAMMKDYRFPQRVRFFSTLGSRDMNHFFLGLAVGFDQ